MVMPHMISRALIAAVALMVAGCASRQSGARPTGLQEGLYAVVARSCDPVSDEENQCPLIQYLEVVRGRFHGVAPSEIALVEWTVVAADATDYTYSARPLRGWLDDGRKYVIDEVNDGQYAVKEWLVIDSGVATAYHFEKQSLGGDAKKSHVDLRLSPTIRDERLNRLLAYPEPVSEESP
jgi:hypothetical protein